MELSEEEIIRNVKRIIEYKVISNYINNYDSRVIQGLLDLYNKQKKEIEELKEKDKEKKAISQAIIRDIFIDRYISKDKIREKIENDKENIETLYNSADFDSAYVRAEIERIRLEKEVLEELLEE